MPDTISVHRDLLPSSVRSLCKCLAMCVRRDRALCTTRRLNGLNAIPSNPAKRAEEKGSEKNKREREKNTKVGESSAVATRRPSQKTPKIALRVRRARLPCVPHIRSFLPRSALRARAII